MPSERRRQRQQRVRHEAGDFVPGTSEEANSELSNTEKSKEKTVSQDNSTKNDTLVKESSEPSNRKLHEQPSNRKLHEQNSNSNNLPRTDVRKRDDVSNRNRVSDKGRGNRNDNFKGPGRPNYENKGYQRRTESNRENSTNVAVIEEKEYEAVMIMETKTETPKQQPELPQPTKYQRSEVISNWLQYELPSDDEPEEGEDYLLGEDFSQILDSNVNKCSGGFLHLKGEMSWGKLDEGELGTHGLGALKVSDLVAALSTIPLHEQLKIPEESLPTFSVSTFKSSADKIKKTYNPNQQYVTDIEIQEKILESLKINENEGLRLNVEPDDVIKKDNQDVNLQFYSAFKPEPTDVDLDSFVREDAAEYSPHVRVTVDEMITENVKEKESMESGYESGNQNKNPQVRGNEGSVSSAPNVNVNSKDKKFKIPKLPEQIKSDITSPNFSFGLSKLSANEKVETESKSKSSKSKSNKPSNSKKPTEKLIEESPIEEPKIDLDEPKKPKKQAPVLIKKSEVENLEDWLDSVLDD